MTTERPAVVGLRTVAVFEAAKGLLVLAAGLGLLSLLHHATTLKAVVLLVNVAIVGYVSYVRLAGRPRRAVSGPGSDRLRHE